MSRQIESMSFENGNIEEYIVSDDNRVISYEILHFFSNIVPYIFPFEHCIGDASDEGDIFFELSSRIHEHGSFIIDDRLECTIFIFHEMESHSSYFDNRIFLGIESGSLEIESDEGVVRESHVLTLRKSIKKSSNEYIKY